jgi:hypothetical protein
MTNLEKLREWLKGDEDAVSLNAAVHQVVEVWDDLIDRDGPVVAEAINNAFYLLFVTIPRNAFYQQHFSVLNPLIESAILDWHAANEFERRRHQLETAFGLRCAGQALTVMCARIIGGVEWARSVNVQLRSSGETYAEYIKGFE